MGTTIDKGINKNSWEDFNSVQLQRYQLQRNRKKRQRKRRRRLARFLLFVFALIYLPALWKWIFHDSIETDILDTGTLEIRIKSEGIFVRNETAVTSPREGIVIPEVDQGERVQNKYDFAIVVDKENQRILAEIENLEKNIIRQFAENNPQVLDGDSDFRNSVQTEVNKLTDIAVNKNLTAINNVKATLEKLLYQRNREIFESTGNRLYLEDKKRELETLREKLQVSATTIQSEFSGIVVWGADSTYEKYSYANIDNLTIEDLELKDNEQTENITSDFETSFSVGEGEMFARLINNDTSWYVCVVSKKDGSRLKTGDSISLKVEGIEDLIPCTVDSIEPLDDKCKVVVSFNRFIEKTVQLRHAKADLVIESVEGLKIPQRSLANVNPYDNTADIFLVRFNRAVRKRVRIIAEQDTFVIIDNLSDTNETDPVRIFDIYVVNPQNIEEGQVID